VKKAVSIFLVFLATVHGETSYNGMATTDEGENIF
jgi:hypothetical protein